LAAHNQHSRLKPKSEGPQAINLRPLSLCAEHVQQLGGVSPLHILMEEK
jgi:hypothetical protein